MTRRLCAACMLQTNSVSNVVTIALFFAFFGFCCSRLLAIRSIRVSVDIHGTHASNRAPEHTAILSESCVGPWQSCLHLLQLEGVPNAELSFGTTNT
mmetsp:Transcript_9943/g.14885  ORF Transcript_9943/g.14885 Transcript_9943/m.14885 type:complete len:97 (-) Transcript_9943:62-352(-)